MRTLNYSKYLSVMLWLVALHSLLVGIGLIAMPASYMEQMGYGTCSEQFFRWQGGVFHIAMAVGYSMAAYNSIRFECLVVFSITLKLFATVFLFSYFIFISSLPVIILSGVSDFLMGIVVLILYRLTKNIMQAGVKSEK
ncbi:MAG: hypothetical protein K8H86_14590 [Ignavibacteriaceae bacterium]|nr:hypothetical protein [Ignavibacteriaceae bacterium]